VFNSIRNSFIQAIYRVADMIGGNERAESALWFLMDRLKANDLERAVLRDLIMGRDSEEEAN
jgi:hypothetical protein